VPREECIGKGSISDVDNSFTCVYRKPNLCKCLLNQNQL
jgi:hypothetical protein